MVDGSHQILLQVILNLYHFVFLLILLLLHNKQTATKIPFHLGLACFILAIKYNWVMNTFWLPLVQVICSFSLLPLHLLYSYIMVLNYNWLCWLYSLLDCNSVALWGFECLSSPCSYISAQWLAHKHQSINVCWLNNAYSELWQVCTWQMKCSLEVS